MVDVHDVLDVQIQVMISAVVDNIFRRALLLAVPRFIICTTSTVVNTVSKGQARRVGVAYCGALGDGFPLVKLDIVSRHAGRRYMHESVQHALDPAFATGPSDAS